MSKVTEYFLSLQERMGADFARIRAALNDRDAKGHANERTLGQFIESYVPEVHLRYNVEIMDHRGATSGEMDICACNKFQLSRDDNALLLAEGVDFVIQVKAILTGTELKRIFDNASRLKSLVRGFSQRGDYFFAHHRSAIPHVIARIPYFVFAYSSALTLNTALDQWQAILVENKSPPIFQPEGIFILDRGALLRVYPDDGSIAASEDEAHAPAWYSTEFDNRVLLAFTATLLRFGRGILQIQNPLHAYMAGMGFTGTTIEKRYGRMTGNALIGEVVWQQLLAGHRALQTAQCDKVEIKEECGRRTRRIEDCVRGEFPREMFEVRRTDGGIVEVTPELLAEIRAFVRHMSGKHPALSPAPRADVPFSFESNSVHTAIDVSIRGAFIADLQQWVEQNCVFFRGPK
jgi:hypothetical protein